MGGGEQPELAKLIGQRLVEQEAIVLTGGEGNTLERKEAKDLALVGAIEYANKSDTIARLVGVLPCYDSLRWRRDRRTNVQALFIETMLSSYQRDLINGVTPDVIIALRGGRGTLAEIAFAKLAGVPVILADSDVFLKAKLVEHAERLKKRIIPEVREKYDSFNGEDIDGATIVKELEQGLNDATNLVRRRQLSGGAEVQAAETVELALLRAREAGTPSMRRFPGVPGSPDSFERFYAELADLG